MVSCGSRGETYSSGSSSSLAGSWPMPSALPAKPERWLSPPAIASLLGCKAEKVISFIKNGEISAVNIASNLLGRPRYRISPEAFEKFLQRRSCMPETKPVRRPRRNGNYTPKYFQ
ncbi:MAG TPA: helix-turn-helix domain-containing protein [Pirellulaceae bacterium]